MPWRGRERRPRVSVASRLDVDYPGLRGLIGLYVGFNDFRRRRKSREPREGLQNFEGILTGASDSRPIEQLLAGDITITAEVFEAVRTSPFGRAMVAPPPGPDSLILARPRDWRPAGQDARVGRKLQGRDHAAGEGELVERWE
jgi:hypothetical protein